MTLPRYKGSGVAWQTFPLTYSLPAHRSSSCGSKAKVVTGVEGAFGVGPGRGILAAYNNTGAASAPGPWRVYGRGQTGMVAGELASGWSIPHSSPPPCHPAVMARRGEHALQGDAHGKMLATVFAAQTRRDRLVDGTRWSVIFRLSRARR